jgi:hypothetical protein
LLFSVPLGVRSNPGLHCLHEPALDVAALLFDPQPVGLAVGCRLALRLLPGLGAAPALLGLLLTLREGQGTFAKSPEGQRSDRLQDRANEDPWEVQMIRPVGGSKGCMTMIVFSIVASIFLTVVVNLLFAMAR